MIQTIKLSQLVPSKRNVRLRSDAAADAQLRADIEARGLLQNLIVTANKKPRGTFAVEAGNRRHAALKTLADEGKIALDFDVPCLVLDDLGSAVSEASLAENFQKLALNPADECLAFQHFVELGSDVDGVARRFGVTVRFVEGRLRLASLAPVVFQALADGEITLDIAKAYASTPDRERQAHVFDQLSRGYGGAHRGDRTIHADQAAVVRRIFSDYAAGKSAKRIAVELNREGISAPSGGDWGFSTINGNPKRGTGILNNELYVGKLVWNRQRFLKDPATGKRQARLNAPEDWITQEVPELRIIHDETWSMVKARQSAMRAEKPEPDASTLSTARDRKRPRYLLSGLTRCGCCGGGYSMISSEMLGCSTARNKGTCDNRTNMRRDELEARVLSALRHHLMEPALFAEFCEEFTREMNRIRSAGSETLEASRAEIRKIDRDLDRLVDMILRGGAADRLNERMVRMEARKRELETVVAQGKEPAPLLHPEMAGYYRRQVESLHEALNFGPEAERLKAADLLRSLISAIVLTPSDSGLEMDVQGDLAGILTIASNAKSPAVLRAGCFAS